MMLRGIAATLCALLLAALAPGGARAAWYEARTPHFRVYANNTAKVVGDYANRLERFDRAMHLLISLRDNPGDIANPVTIFVVPGTGAIERLCRDGRAKASGCSGTAGFYQAMFGGSYAFTARLTSGTDDNDDLNGQAILFHEYAHHVMFGGGAAAYPVWYSEGFAEFWATAKPEADGSVLVGRAPPYRSAGLVYGVMLPIETLLTTTVAELRGLEQRSQLYGQGWMLTHYLTFDKARTGQLARYLALINEGKPSLVAAKTAFGDLKALNRNLQHYVNVRLSGFSVTADKLAEKPAEVRPLSAGETAMLPVRWRSKHGVNKTIAPAVAADARRLAAPYPDDPRVQDALAEAEYDAGDDAAAEAAADRALAKEPKDVVALLYKGLARLRRALAQQGGDTPAWREARGWFVRANRIEPEAALPLALFYLSFVQAKLAPTANAILGLERASDLQPQDYTVRVMLLRQYVLDGKLKEARQVLAPIAFNPHAQPDSWAGKLLAQIDADDRPALKAWAGKTAAEPDTPDAE